VSTTQKQATDKTAQAIPEPAPHTIDPSAPAGTADSLGAESVRDGRPASSDEVVEAIDEEGPGINEAA
jgi:hypothetical protein